MCGDAKMRNRHPRQNQKSGIVGQQMNIAPPCFHSPADELVSASQMPWRTGPRQTSDRLSFRRDQILQVLTDGLFVTQIVILIDQAIEQRLLRRSPAPVRSESGPKSLKAPHTGRSSATTGLGFAGLPCGRRRTAGSSISPPRSSINSRPRQTMSRSTPLACFQIPGFTQFSG